MDEEIERINKEILNETSELKPVQGFEIIAEALVYKIYDLFGRNTLLSMLYQVGSGPGEIVAEKIKADNKKEEFNISEALVLLLNELKDSYCIQVKSIEKTDEKIRLLIDNHCFIRDAVKKRDKLKPGKAFCRIPKGYFETAFKKLIGSKVKNVDINFLSDDPENDCCEEELIFYLR